MKNIHDNITTTGSGTAAAAGGDTSNRQGGRWYYYGHTIASFQQELFPPRSIYTMIIIFPKTSLGMSTALIPPSFFVEDVQTEDVSDNTMILEARLCRVHSLSMERVEIFLLYVRACL